MNTLRIPFVKSDRAAFFVVFLIGMVLCTRGVSQAVVRGWFHPISILGYILGALALLLGASVLFRRRVAPIKSDRAALITLLGIIATKFVLAALYGVIA